MRIIDKMLLKELVWSFLAVLIVLVLITFGAEATKLLAKAVEGKVQVALVGQILLLKLPMALELILPLAALIGVMLTFGRLYQDQEMVVMNSCGIAPSYFRRILLWFLIPLTLIAYAISNLLSPYALTQEKELMAQQNVVSPVAALVPGKFNSLPNNKGVFYAKTLTAEGRLEEVWVKYRDGENDLVLMAPKGFFITSQDQVILRLQNGWRYQNLHNGLNAQLADSTDGTAKKKDIEIQYFESFEGILPELSPAKRKIKDDELSSWQLAQSDNLRQQAVLQWRISAPLGVLALGLIGLQLSRTGPRQGRFSKVFIAIVLFVLFNQLLIAGQNAIEDGIWPLAIGLWPIPILFLLIGLGFIGYLKPKLLRLWPSKTKPLKVEGGR